MGLAEQTTRMMPRVSIMMPLRQEGAGLRQVLEAVIAQDYPALDSIVVAVGPSSDQTGDIVAQMAQRSSKIIAIANPEGIVSTGLNRALQLIRSEYVVRIDGHCLVPPDYVSRLVVTSTATHADCVGPRLQTIGSNVKQRGIAAAMSSPFGVGGARFRTSTRSGYVDTVPFGLYRREVFERIGGFREELVRNQDDELNSRLRRAGGRIYMDADVVVDYFPRSSFRALWRQYFQYGYWRVITARFLADPLRPRQLAPATLLLGLALATILAVSGAPGLLLLVGVAYAAVLVLCALQSFRFTRSTAVALTGAAAAALLHFAYGSGSWWSLLRARGFGPGRRTEAAQ
jgi:succinoglycan biosynthesis protein ExoA